MRLIGIDTPEIGRGGEASECYADEAHAFLDELVYGHQVELVGDPTQGDVDKYGRLLRYVYVDGQSAAEMALVAGAGYEYTYDTAYRDQQAHRDAEQAAADMRAGLWWACS
ncbi:thermonuclease family protein [Microbacterium sp. NPDC055665]